MAPDPDLSKPVRPVVPSRKLGDLSESDEEKVEEDLDAELKRIFAARKKGSMTDEQQKYHAKTQERKQMIRRRTQSWIACEGTHVQLDEEEKRLLAEACKTIFSSLTDANRVERLTKQLERLLTLLPPQNRYSYYSLHLDFQGDRAMGLSTLAELLVEDEYESPMETLAREEARIARLQPDSDEHMSSDDRVSACVLRARLSGGSYVPTLPQATNDTSGAFIRFQEVLAAGSRVDSFQKAREDLIWHAKKELKQWVHEESGFDFKPWETVHETPIVDPQDY